MRRLSCSVLFSATLLVLVNADDGWRRLEAESRAPSWARSSNPSGNRVPFAPEDIAMPPPWLLPTQQPQVGFPAAQAQVRSFFDEEPIDWPPRLSKPTTPKSIQPQQPQQTVQKKQAEPQILHTSLQPPRLGSASEIHPVQHIWYEGDRHPVPQRSQPEVRVNPHYPQQVQQQHAPVVAFGKSREPSVPQNDPKKLPASSATIELNDPYRTVPAESPAGRHHQPKQLPSASRKSVISSYDSSEYDYDEEGAIISTGHQDKNRPISPKNGHDELEGDQGFYGHHAAAVEAVVSVGAAKDEFYESPAPKLAAPANAQRRNQPVHQQHSRRNPQQQQQVNSAEQSELEEHQSFDASKTIFRPSTGQNFRQHPSRPSEYDESRQRESGRPPVYGDDAPSQVTERQPAKSKQQGQQQAGVRRQQQQRPSERNPSPPESPAFEAERPSFHSPNLQAPHSRQGGGPQHRQQQQHQPQHQAGEWPQRGNPAPEATRKSKPRVPYRPEEPAESFGNGARSKPKNPSVPPHRYQEEREENQSRDHHPRPPYHNPPAPYRPTEEEPSYDRPESHHQPTYEFPEEPKVKQQRPRRPQPDARPEFEQPQSHPRLPPAYQNQAEENSYDPYDEDHRPEEPHREHDVQHHQAEPEEQPDHHQPEEHQVEEPRPVSPAPSRRPQPNGRPSFHSGEQFSGADNTGNGHNDGDFNQPGPFNGPPQRPHHPQGNRQRPNRPPPHHRPRDSVVTQGLNTLKSLVGLQTSPQRPRPPHPQFNHDGRRPEGNRPDGHRPDGRRPTGRRPTPHHPEENVFNNNGGDLGRLDQSENIDEFDPSNFDGFGIQGRQNIQPALDEPMEHRSDPNDEDLAPAATASTESTSRTTAQPARTATPEPAPPASTTAAPIEEAKSTLFPPFSKRVRPQPPSPAQTESKTSSGKDGSASGQLRITSYKQRIEAMKERARLREQQQQQAQSKKDSDPDLEVSDSAGPASSSSTSTSSTTARPSTTRPKVPPRMPVRKPLTSASTPSPSTSTTEATPAPLMDKQEKSDESNFEQYKRRFKPKSSFSRRPMKDHKDDEPVAVDTEINKEEELPAAAGKKNLFGKLPTSPFGRRRQQQEEERLLAEENAKSPVKPLEELPMPAVPVRVNKENNKRIRPGYGRTTTVTPAAEPSLDDDQESGSVLAPPNQWSATSEPQDPAKSATPNVEKAQEEEELPKIELVSVSSPVEDEHHNKPELIEEANEFPIQQQPFPFELDGPTLQDKPEQEAEHLGVDMDGDSHTQQEKPRQSFFTMATNDPILPIEELLNIRVRDNGKGM